MPRKLIPLSEVKAGSCALVHGLQGGKELSNRLLVLGFTIGVEVTVLQNMGYGPIIITVRDGRIALGRGEAKKVIVEVIKRGWA